LACRSLATDVSRSLPDRVSATSELRFELLVKFFRLTVNAIGIVFYLSVCFWSAELVPGRRAYDKGGVAGDRRNEAAKNPARNTRCCRAATYHPGQSGRRGALQYGVRASNAFARRYCSAGNLREEAVSCADPFTPSSAPSERPLRTDVRHPGGGVPTSALGRSSPWIRAHKLLFAAWSPLAGEGQVSGEAPMSRSGAELTHRRKARRTRDFRLWISPLDDFLATQQFDWHSPVFRALVSLVTPSPASPGSSR